MRFIPSRPESLSKLITRSFPPIPIGHSTLGSRRATRQTLSTKNITGTYFAKRYVVSHRPTKSLEVDDVLLQDFRKSLDEANISYTQADLVDNNDWIKSNIKAEIFVDAFGQDEGMKVRAESDPEVVKGLDLLPQAKALADNAKRIVAEHNSAGAFNR